jgi:D-alanine-D-alanine ligase
VRDGVLPVLAPPVIVKPNFEGSSKGITAASIVTESSRLAGVAADVHARYPAGVLVEELVAGIDVAVGWIDGLGLLPSIWYRYDAIAPHAIYDYALKHETPERVQVEIPAPLSGPVRARLARATTRAVTALGIRGYGRADFRITPHGEVVFLEMNPLPSLTLATGHDELYAAAARRGLSPGDVIERILAGVELRSEAHEPIPLGRSA